MSQVFQRTEAGALVQFVGNPSPGDRFLVTAEDGVMFVDMGQMLGVLGPGTYDVSTLQPRFLAVTFMNGRSSAEALFFRRSPVPLTIAKTVITVRLNDPGSFARVPQGPRFGEAHVRRVIEQELQTVGNDAARLEPRLGQLLESVGVVIESIQSAAQIQAGAPASAPGGHRVWMQDPAGNTWHGAVRQLVQGQAEVVWDNGTVTWVPVASLQSS